MQSEQETLHKRLTAARRAHLACQQTAGAIVGHIKKADAEAKKNLRPEDARALKEHRANLLERKTRADARAIRTGLLVETLGKEFNAVAAQKEAAKKEAASAARAGAGEVVEVLDELVELAGDDDAGDSPKEG